MNTSETKLSDLSAGDEVFFDLKIFPIERITPTGRIVTKRRSLSGMFIREMWRKDGTRIGDNIWRAASIKPLTDKDRARILAARNRKTMTSILNSNIWGRLNSSQLEQVLVLIESFDGGE